MELYDQDLYCFLPCISLMVYTYKLIMNNRPHHCLIVGILVVSRFVTVCLKMVKNDLS